MPEYAGDGASTYFDPELAALERKHDAQSQAGQDDYDDQNDICDCQEIDHPS